MLSFFFGWLVCLTIFVAFLWRKEDKKELTVHKAPQPSLSTVGFTKPPHQGAEFLESTRVEEIIKNKKDVKIDDILG